MPISCAHSIEEKQLGITNFELSTAYPRRKWSKPEAAAEGDEPLACLADAGLQTGTAVLVIDLDA